MVTRISGLGSGMDIDGMITKLMAAERAPQDKLKQKSQSLQWKEDAYRSMNTLAASFRDMAANLRFASNWQQTTSTSSDTTKLTVSSTPSATPGSHTIQINSLANGATKTSTGAITSQTGVNGGDLASSVTIDASNDSFAITVNGTVKTITLADATYTQATLKSALQSAIDAQFGANQVTVGNNASGNGLSLNLAGSTSLSFTASAGSTALGFAASTSLSVPSMSGSAATVPVNAASNNNTFNITLNGVTKTITVADSSDLPTLKTNLQSAIDTAFGANQLTVGYNAANNGFTLTPSGNSSFLPQFSLADISGGTGVEALGFTNGQTYKLDVNAALSSQAGLASGSYSFTINGQQISYSSTDTLATVMSRVNSSSAGVTMTYDSVSDKIAFTTKNTGDAAIVNIGGDTGSLLSYLKIDTTTTAKGQNSDITIDGLQTSQATNSFTSNGVTYNLLNTTAGSQVVVNVGMDTTSLAKSITDFVNNYNTLISTISTKLNEPKYRDYQPLTDDQKSAMKDSDITLWNQKAQSGLLQNDDLLKKAYNDMRSVVSTKVTNVSGNYNLLSQIGITTNPYNPSDPASAGKLSIDQSKLTAAIAADPQGVVDLISNVGSSGSSDRGVAQQFYDISNNLITSIASRAGNAGSLYDDTSTEIGSQVHSLALQITDWTDKLNKKEDYYYQMFTEMDNAIAKGNSQLQWLQSQA